MKPGRDRLLEILGAFPGRRVAVLADLVADEYLLCKTSRISREAPAALILRWEGRQVRPGGGANAIANLCKLGAEVLAVGVVGDDQPGHELLGALQALKLDLSGVRVDPRFHTVVKSRVLTAYHHSTRQQVLRIDREDRLDGNLEALAWLGAAARERLADAHALLVSDYGYGVALPALAREAAAEARRHDAVVTLDSRYRLLEHHGVGAATPNQPEVEEALGLAIGDDLAALEGAGRELLERMSAPAILVTRGSQGMSLFERAGGVEHIPVFGSDEIADVTGAGDTVIAVFTLALAAGASHAEAAHLANYAGGIVVMKLGTATVSPEELAAAVRDEPR